jgi:Spy/CpxP family protein refolding chaperone
MEDPRETVMKRLIGMTLLGLAVAAAPVAAQLEGEGRGPRDGRRGRGMKAVVDYLGLTAEQQERWTALHEQHREAMKPFREEGRALRQRVQESLEAGESEVDVGAAVKALHAHREAGKQAREAFQEQLKSTLTDEQKVKFDAFQELRGAGRKGRGGRGRGHRGGGGGGTGWGSPPVEG